MGQLLPQCIHAWKSLPSPGQGSTGGKHKCSWSGSGLGTQAQPLLGDTGSTQREIPTFHFQRAQNSPPLLPPVFGKVRGTPQTRDIDTAEPKPKGNPWKKGQHPQPEEIQLWEGAECPGPALLPQPGGIWDSLGATLGYCTWQAAGVQNCHFPHAGLHPQQL